MQQVIDELLKAEAEAQRIIAQAQEEAQKKKAQVESDYSLSLNETREKARRLVLARAEKTRADIAAAHTVALEKARAEKDAHFQDKQPIIDRITDEVISLI